jgi:hypothetical protein
MSQNTHREPHLKKISAILSTSCGRDIDEYRLFYSTFIAALVEKIWWRYPDWKKERELFLEKIWGKRIKRKALRWLEISPHKPPKHMSRKDRLRFIKKKGEESLILEN